MTDVAWLASTILLPLVLTEVTELGPWLARRVVQGGARLIVPRARAARFEEEWLAGLEEWPGKLMKLIRALVLVLFAVPRINLAWLDQWWERHVGGPAGVRMWSFNLKLQLGANVLVRRSVKREHRCHLTEFNRVLAMVLHQVRSTDPDQRAAALALIDDLIQNPMPWVRDVPITSAMARLTFASLVDSVEAVHGA